jgi:hypothetical protein
MKPQLVMISNNFIKAAAVAWGMISLNKGGMEIFKKLSGSLGTASPSLC